MISSQGKDMDAEITVLEGKLSTARQVKAGMMSVLLTGKIRLNRD
jgi:HAMP domain-containing protein